MDAERARAHLLSLPHVVETEQWGGIVFWVGDKAIGGKMCAMIHPDGPREPVSWAAGGERYAELLELEGMHPAPYLARVFWVAAERWGVLREREWVEELTAAHAVTLAKLPPKTLATLALPKADQQRLISARRTQLAAKSSRNP